MGAKLKKLGSFLLDCISFNSPQAIVFNLCAIFLILIILPAESLAHSPFHCIFKHYIIPFFLGGNCPTSGFFAGCRCPGCGLTRGMSRLLHGDIAGAIEFNVLVIPVFIVMVGLIVVNIKRMRGSRIGKRRG